MFSAPSKEAMALLQELTRIEREYVRYVEQETRALVSK